MDDLVDFLRERLDEDAKAARAAAAGGRWRYSGGDSVGAWMLYDEHWLIANLKTYRHDEYDYSERMPAFRNPEYVNADANGAHIARHDPSRVLSEVAVKRGIVIEHQAQVRNSEKGLCTRPTNRVLHLLALPYSSHPDYREAWRP